MIQRNLLLLICATTMYLFASCMADDLAYTDQMTTIDEVEPYILTQIRIETAEGDNLLSQFSDIDQAISSNSLFNLEDVDWLDVRCVRGSDGAQMTLTQTCWYTPFGETETAFYGQGPMLCLTWLDFDWHRIPSSSLPSLETYTLHIRSQRFWPDEEHIIEWGVEVRSGRQYSISWCKVDGKEQTNYYLEDNYGRHFVGFVRLRPF